MGRPDLDPRPRPLAAGGATAILMYYSISADPPRSFRKFAISPRRFDEQLSFLAERKGATLTVGEIMSRRDRGEPCPDRAVVLTFDDGFADFNAHALPALARHGMRATLHVATRFVGGVSGWLGGAESRQPILSWPQLAEIAKCGVEIGAHSVSHPALDRLPDDALRREVGECRGVLQDALGIDVTSFAYPFGFHSRRVREEVEASGYASAYAVQYRLSRSDEDRFALSRHIIDETTEGALTAALVTQYTPTVATDLARLRSLSWTFIGQNWIGNRYG